MDEVDGSAVPHRNFIRLSASGISALPILASPYLIPATDSRLPNVTFLTSDRKHDAFKTTRNTQIQP